MKKVTPQPIFGRDMPDSVLRLCREYSEALNQLADHRFSEFVQVSASYTAGENDHVIECSTSGAMTVTLPAASVMRNKRVVIKRANNTTHTITIQSTSGTIDDAASVTLTTAYQSREVFSDGSEWWLLDAAAGPPTDPYFANVVLLLPLNGSNGQTTTTDLSPSANSMTMTSIALSTAQSKFGPTSAGEFDGSPRYIECDWTSDFGFAGDFTIEAWVYLTGTSYKRTIFESTDGTGGVSIGFDTSNQFGLFLDGSDTQTITQDTPYASANAWHHCAVCRKSGRFYVYFNGQRSTAYYDSTGDFTPSSPTKVRVGCDSGGTINRPFVGYIDEVRVTNGVARYDGDFTPPTSPFPTS